MKRLLLMTLITITCIFAGVLYGGYRHHEKSEEISVDRQYMNLYPETMPNLVLDPMTNIPF
jgi:hypothetical protein